MNYVLYENTNNSSSLRSGSRNNSPYRKR